METHQTTAKAKQVLSEHDVPRWDREEDVVVIGAGFAGLAAAIEAHDNGAGVVVIEKMRAPGGNSSISEGGIAAPNTAIQDRLGIEDSPDLMYKDMVQAGMGLNHPSLVKVVADHALEAFRWSAEYLGVEYIDRIDQFGGHSVPRCYAAVGVTGSTIIKRQVARLEQLGVPIRLRTRFEQFVLNASGTVAGILVREGYDHKNPEAGAKAYIKVKKAVVLATGGFGSDVAFRSAQDPRLTADIDSTNTPYATAEALVETLRIQAMPVHLSHIQLGPWASPDEKGYGAGPRFADYTLFQYGLIVSPDTCERIVNELADRKIVADAILAVGRPCIGIADERALQQSGWAIDRALKKGVVKPFESLSDLSAHYGLAEQSLRSTIEKFNSYVLQRSDTDFAKPIIDGAAPVENPPYYAMRLWPKVHHTMGGVRIDASARVIDLDGNPIPRLFAAGEAAGGVHGACRLGSCAITDCLVFGRIAGRNAASL